MTPTEQNVAAAESIGKVERLSDAKYAAAMKEWENEDEHPHASLTKPVRVRVLTEANYFSDLNAMHDLEKTLKWEKDDEYCEAAQYYEQLIFICGRSIPKGKAFGYICHVCGEGIFDTQPTEHSESGLIHSQCPQADCYDWHLVTATAPQRLEAYLRVKGLWKETT